MVKSGPEAPWFDYACVVAKKSVRRLEKAYRWVLRSALNFASDGEIVREVGREFQRKGPEKAKADLAKECLTRVKKKREEEDDRKPGRLGSINISDKYLGNNLD
ncbi:hypothetical protein HELRODRAFT_175810 [Helobdella robusta]|uniref:Uncharacterized protein n=1 Tax=Helobdella robusta TaxID=6412 RepID=T1F9P6_HELRO|nr:hypothetical protein HELRODRAFT_175810 [Helobdella robusta]ESO00393.1 hypothetical protein HELRODRAFT_175810 [Helobdella robusta]